MYNQSKEKYISDAKVHFSSQSIYLRKYSLLIQSIRQGWGKEQKTHTSLVSMSQRGGWPFLDPTNIVAVQLENWPR